MPTTVETIREGFPYPSIDQQPGCPTYAIISEVHKKLKTNSASVHSNLGGGQHGLLGLTLQDRTYTTLTGVPFILPTNPGTVPNIPAGSSGPQISQFESAHKEELREWQETTRADQALQQQLLSVFDEEYLRGLRNMHMGYVGVSTNTMLQHLYDNYGVITAVDIEDNDTTMRAEYDPSQPIEVLFHQIETAVEFAEAGNRPYDPKQVVSRAYLLILKTGLYAEACKDWENKTEPQKTWVSFKAYFTKHHRDLRLMQTASGNAGYKAGFNIIQDHAHDEHDSNNNQELEPTERNDILAALANVATQGDSTMATTRKELTTTLQALKEKVVGIHEGKKRKKNNNSQFYCWTHGRTRNKNHISSSCNNKKEGHQDDATLDNKKGGCHKYCNEFWRITSS